MINAVEYGRALFLLTEEVGNTEKVREDVTVLLAVLKENASAVSVISPIE